MAEDSSIWTEKYRPKTFDSIKGQEATVQKLKAFVKQKNLPHLMFTGPAGVGKSTIALVIAREFYGESYRENFLELNASDERGIDIVRSKVKDFARTKAIGNVPFKIIFLDECDALTKEAQQALRRTMENHTSTCRFILAANYSSKIIDPIQSRCAVFRFRPLTKEQLLPYITNIAEKEKLTISQEAKDALVTIAEGDCRKATNIMQSAASDAITPETIFSLASVAEPKEVKEVLTTALKGDFIKAREKLLRLKGAFQFKDYKYTKADIVIYDEAIKVLDTFAGEYIKEWLGSLSIILNNLLNKLNIRVEFSADKDFIKVYDNEQILKYDQLSTGQRCFLGTIFKLAILLQQNKSGIILLDDGLNNLDRINFRNLIEILKTLPFQAICVYQNSDEIEDTKHFIVTRENGESNVSF